NLSSDCMQRESQNTRVETGTCRRWSSDSLTWRCTPPFSGVLPFSRPDHPAIRQLDHFRIHRRSTVLRRPTDSSQCLADFYGRVDPADTLQVGHTLHLERPQLRLAVVTYDFQIDERMRIRKFELLRDTRYRDGPIGVGVHRLRVMTQHRFRLDTGQ